MEAVFPVFLRLAGRAVLVVGGGTIATRKVEDLLESRAVVRVVSPVVTAEIDAWARAGRVTVEIRGFEATDVEGAWLVISATNDPAVNRRVADACAAHRIFVCAVDDPASASMFFGSVVRRPPFVIALSSEGELPGLTRLVREVIEQSLPSQDWIATARQLRREWKAAKTPMADRFQELVRKIAQSGSTKD